MDDELTGPMRVMEEDGALDGGKAREKVYDLEERTLRFAQEVRAFVKTLPRTVANVEDIRQLVRASGSVGANYIEANEALGRRDFAMHLRISRKEAKESRYWLRLVDTGDDRTVEPERHRLAGEAHELASIFSSIVRKCDRPVVADRT